MGGHIDAIVHVARLTNGYGQKLVEGVRPEQAARKPRFEGAGAPVVVDTNHPTFVFGHLSLYPARLLALLKLEGSKAAVPEPWTAMFKSGAQCQDDPAGTIYPPFSIVRDHYFSASEVCLAELAKLDDAVLLRPNPEERFAKMFPTVGGMAGFILSAHPMSHFGQVSAWRRCFGMPTAM
jgi:hypothetical protein